MKKYYLLCLGLCSLLATSGWSQTYHSTTVNAPSATAVSVQAKDLNGGGHAGHHDHGQSPNGNGHVHTEKCLSDIIQQRWLQDEQMQQRFQQEQQAMMDAANQAGPATRATYTIPVVFHVVYNNATENVSQAAIQAVFDGLNEDFQLMNSDASNARPGFTPANVDVEFCLAMRDPWGNPMAEPGINRVSSSESYFDPDTETNKMKSSSTNGVDPWPRADYINVWICDITNGASSGTAGYAYLPTTSTLPPASWDGIVIDYNLGMTPSNRVLTHEMGHFLGLPHTWGNSGGCSDDDGINDTPLTDGPAFNNNPSGCGDPNLNTCGVLVQYENYMDYSNCTVMFTQGQANVINGILTSSRTSLTSSNGCNPVNPQPPVAEFTADITTVIQGGTVNFTDLSTNFPTGWSWDFGGGATPGTSTNQDPSVQFTGAPGTYTVTLTSSNAQGSDVEAKAAYITVVAPGGGAAACDTSRHYTAAEFDNAIYYTTGEGHYPGFTTLNTGAFTVLASAEPYTAASPTNVRRMRFELGNIENGSGSAQLVFSVWNDNAGEPAATPIAGGTVTVNLADVANGVYFDGTSTFHTIDFPGPGGTGVPVSGNYWVGVQYQNWSSSDSIAFTCAMDRGTGNPNTTWVEIDGGIGWLDAPNLFTGGLYTSAMWDVLTSNGPAPVAVLSTSATTVCDGQSVAMNGYSSTNATDYIWYFDDGSNNYFYDQGNFDFTFSQATWDIDLVAEASCMSDVDNTTLVVNPALVVVPTSSAENCQAQDGTITLAVSGGNGGSYNYSLDGGATFGTVNTFNNLIAGTYNWVVNDGTQCESSGTRTVSNVNAFAPTITADHTIMLGNSTSLTVSGGVSWDWYEGLNYVGNTATINVSPTVTTIYTVTATDGSGCTRDLTVTVTVDASSGVEELGLENDVRIFPNPSAGSFTVDLGSHATAVDVEVYNAAGQLVYNSKAAAGTESVEVDLTGQAEGVYSVRLSDGEQTTTRQISVLR